MSRYMDKYTKENYDVIHGYLPKGKKKVILDYCAIVGVKSINQLINTALRKELGISEEEWFQKEVVE